MENIIDKEKRNNERMKDLSAWLGGKLYDALTDELMRYKDMSDMNAGVQVMAYMKVCAHLMATIFKSISESDADISEDEAVNSLVKSAHVILKGNKFQSFKTGNNN